MPVTNSEWFVNSDACIGIVQIDVVDEDTGTRKCYIGIGGGHNVPNDQWRIANRGVPFRVPTWLKNEITKSVADKAISAFFAEVCRRAERKMAMTGTLEGAHYASMVEIMTERGLINS